MALGLFHSFVILSEKILLISLTDSDQSMNRTKYSLRNVQLHLHFINAVVFVFHHLSVIYVQPDGAQRADSCLKMIRVQLSGLLYANNIV